MKRKLSIQRQYINKNAAGGSNVKSLLSVLHVSRKMTIKARVIMVFRNIAKTGDTTSCFFRYLNTANLRV
jgi:hypothetical protein